MVVVERKNRKRGVSFIEGECKHHDLDVPVWTDLWRQEEPRHTCVRFSCFSETSFQVEIIEKKEERR